MRLLRRAVLACCVLFVAVSARAQKTELVQGEYLRNFEFIVSPSRTAFAIIQSDGHLCVYRGSGPGDNRGGIWCNGAPGPGGQYFVTMQADGNLAVYRGTGPRDNQGLQWHTQRTGPGGKFFLKVYDDGNLAVTQGQPGAIQTVIWQTGNNAPGTKIPQGGIVILTNEQSQRQLSAVPAETLAMSSNRDAWEQWAYSDYGLMSYHGTQLALELSTPRHVPKFGWTDDGPLSATPFPTTIYGLRAGDRVLLTNGYRYLVENNGSFAVGNDLSRPQANGWWIVSLAGSPAPGRSAERRAVCDGSVMPLRSAHGTYLKYDNPSRVYQGAYVGGLSSTFLGTATTQRCMDKPLRFGNTVEITWQWRDSQGTKGPAYLKPWNTQINGLQTVYWKALDRAQAQFTILPTAGYQNGARVPWGAKFLLRNTTTGTHLSAVGGTEHVVLSPSTGGWEMWEFHQP